jgi:hypothetical protein
MSNRSSSTILYIISIYIVYHGRDVFLILLLALIRVSSFMGRAITSRSGSIPQNPRSRPLAIEQFDLGPRGFPDRAIPPRPLPIMARWPTTVDHPSSSNPVTMSALAPAVSSATGESRADDREPAVHRRLCLGKDRTRPNCLPSRRRSASRPGAVARRRLGLPRR